MHQRDVELLHRSSRWANAGLVVSVQVDDYAREGFEGPLAGLEWQRKWERRAYELGGGGFVAPAARLGDYLKGVASRDLPASSYRPGLKAADLRSLFPAFLHKGLGEAVRGFERKMRGFLTEEALLVGVESRTSSPVRLTRADSLQSTAVPGSIPAAKGPGTRGQSSARASTASRSQK